MNKCDWCHLNTTINKCLFFSDGDTIYYCVPKCSRILQSCSKVWQQCNFITIIEAKSENLVTFSNKSISVTPALFTKWSTVAKSPSTIKNFGNFLQKKSKENKTLLNTYIGQSGSLSLQQIVYSLQTWKHLQQPQ